MNYNTVYVGMDVHKEIDAKCVYKNEGHDYSEIYFTVYYNVERMLEFEKYLSKIRKKDLGKYSIIHNDKLKKIRH